MVFVDTLDNTASLQPPADDITPFMFGSFSDENIGRIKRQNARKISVAIGNPPYNAWQENYNGRNPNRPYQWIDSRIGKTYRKASNAQNTSSLSDMYVRFYRWVSDRLGDDGIVAFVTNRNFIDKLAFDGFRKSVAAEFAEIWLIDLGGDVRANPKLSGTKHNAMGIQTGLTIAFMVRNGGKRGPATIRYARRLEDETAADKLAWLGTTRLEEVQFATVRPNKDGVWLDQSDGHWATLLPLADPMVGAADTARIPKAIFRLSSNGLETGRDEWVWAESKPHLETRVKFLINSFNRAVIDKATDGNIVIKWDRQLNRFADRAIKLKFERSSITKAVFRPFLIRYTYFDPHLNAYQFRLPSMFKHEPNPAIAFSSIATEQQLAALAVPRLFDKGLLKTGNGRTFGVTRYRYLPSGERVDNVTDWAAAQFAARYPETAITKDAIFAYVYAALHDPVYRTTYAADLRREFPRIPLHDDFARWQGWGQALLDLHNGYETVAPFALTRVDAGGGKPPSPKLRSLPETGVIVLDTDTQLTGVPRAAWDYRLGNRSAIDWVLDQHKEKTIKDPTVRALFDTYRFADHKEQVIDLLGRVVAVSVATVAIVEEMREMAQA